ncbi:MAG TPA: O-antigen ligase family protein [Ancylobacter sp.]
MSSRTAPPRARKEAGGVRRPSESRALFARATRHEAFNDALFVGLLLVLAWVPFWLGSNRPIAWGINAALFGLLTVAFEIGLLVGGARHPVAPRRLWWALVMFAGLVGWIVFQISPWAPAAWQAAFWQMAGDLLAGVPGVGTVEGRISVIPDQGIIGLVRLLTCAAAFYLALQLCRDRARAEMFPLAMVAIATAYALYGIVQLLFFPMTLLWIDKPAYFESVTSTFINRNSYATYAGIGLVIALGVLIDAYRRAGAGRDAPFVHRVAAVVEITGRRGLVLMVAAAIIAIALFWTTSRAGTVSSLIGALVLLLFVVTLMRRRLVLVAIVLVALAGLIGVLVMYGDSVAERLSEEGGSDMRLAITSRTFEAALDVMWTGFGYGSFDRMFAVYRNTDTWVTVHWDKAHNTYVEMLFDLGFPAAIAFGLMVLGLLLTVFVNLLGRDSRPMLSLTALAVSAAVFSHAALDFSLQIQAVAITYWALLGAGLAQSWSRRIDTSL